MKINATDPVIGVDAACPPGDVGRNAVLVVCPEPDTDVLRRVFQGIVSATVRVEHGAVGGSVRRVDGTAVVSVTDIRTRAAVIREGRSTTRVSDNEESVVDTGRTPTECDCLAWCSFP